MKLTIFLISGLLCFTTQFLSAQNQNGISIDVSIQLLKIDSSLAAPLQERLISGGPLANQAVDQFPTLIKQGKIEQVEQVEFQMISGQRNKSATGDKRLSLDGEGIQQYTEGLTIEVDPVVGRDGNLDLNFALEYVRQERRDIADFKTTTQVSIPPNQPFLLCRWQREDEILFAVFTAAYSSESKGESTDRNIYTDVKMYDNSGKLVASTLFPARSGNRAKAEVILPSMVDVEGFSEYMSRGLTAEIDPTLPIDGEVVDMSFRFDYGVLPGGSGAKASRAKMYTAKSKEVFTPNEEKTLEVKETELRGENPKSSNWSATAMVIVPKPVSPGDAFDLLKKERVDKPYDAALKDAAKKYTDALAARYRQALSAGNQATAEALKKEAINLRAGQTIPKPDAPADPMLQQLRRIYYGLLSDAEAQRSANLDKLKQEMPAGGE